MFLPDSCDFYILAGGQSSRFGSDKAIAEVDGRPLILRVADAFAPFSSTITVISDGFRQYDRFGLRTIHDLNPGRGPCEGIATAMNDTTADWVFVAGCDATGLHGSFVECFRGVTGPAAAFRFDDFWEPLFAAYAVTHRSAWEDAALKQRSVSNVLTELGAEEVVPPEGWGRVQGWNERLFVE